MRNDLVLEKAVKRLKGLKFEAGISPFNESDDIYATLVGSTEDDIPVIEARDLIEANATKLMRVCMQYEDVYRRLRGHEAFCDHQSSYDDNDYYEEEESTKTTYLTKLLDQYISMVDSVSMARPTRGVRNLIAPKDINLTQRLAGTELETIVWPPGHFVEVDIAIMGEETIRKEVFGITTTRNRGSQDAIRFPHDQDSPLMVRKYLSWLSLTKKKSDSHCALFLAPVAFIDHKERQEWYEHTGRQARFYATIHEFLDYAHDEFEKISMDYKSHAICLLTPVFTAQYIPLICNLL
ncbi:hypothetical protein F5X96DRAFT_685869 [Biscogniauxia mediterranea]|nr:hypothetical protein F5X96DRAFT_685869 [Biscogniauxia mediterranea]